MRYLLILGLFLTQNVAICQYHFKERYRPCMDVYFINYKNGEMGFNREGADINRLIEKLNPYDRRLLFPQKDLYSLDLLNDKGILRVCLKIN